MFKDSVSRSRQKSILTTVILITIPCYLVGLIVLWVGNGVQGRATPTPTETLYFEEQTPVSPMPGTPTLPLPSAVFPSATATPTPTISLTPTMTRTYLIPTSTASFTPTITVTETLAPTATDTLTPDSSGGAPPP
ncbi:MAG: hypothetical protein KBD67_03105 [Anaerolineaceae bacterium]|nr:hypothetical protein [Anaerolineaceae bacterium]